MAFLEEFFDISQSAWLAAMKSAFSDEYVLSLGASQEHAWKDCYEKLQKYLPLIDNDNKQFGIIFEYALPYESGRRPDVLLVSKEQVIILEFKMKNIFLPEDIDQVAAYARDIREYDGYIHMLNRHIYPYFKQKKTLLSKVKPIDIQMFEASKLDEGLSPNSVIKQHAVIRSALQYAVKNKLIKENVADLVDKPHRERYEASFYDRDELEKLLPAIQEPILKRSLMTHYLMRIMLKIV